MERAGPFRSPVVSRWRARARIFAALVGLSAVVAVACNVVVLHGGAVRGTSDRVEAILVLGAGVTEDGRPSDVLGDRLETARALYAQGRAPRILVSGDRSGPGYDEPGVMRAWLIEAGVPEGAIETDPGGFDTYRSIVRAREIHGLSRVLVVTQRFHLSRALYVARKSGLEADGVAADRRVYRAAGWFAAREILSRTKAWFDVATGRRI